VAGKVLQVALCLFEIICEFIGLELGQMELHGAHELRGPCELAALLASS
jgi:hypothetical protein